MGKRIKTSKAKYKVILNNKIKKTRKRMFQYILPTIICLFVSVGLIVVGIIALINTRENNIIINTMSIIMIMMGLFILFLPMVYWKELYILIKIYFLQKRLSREL